MKLLFIALVAAAVALATTTSASAKELREVKICGPAACRAITDQAAMQRITEGGYQTLAASRASEYYSVTYTVDEGGHTVSWSAWYIPATRRLAGVGERGFRTWTDLWDSAAAAFRAATAGLAPFPTPVPTEVLVAGKPVATGLASYLDLYRVGKPYSGPQGGTGRVSIRLKSATPTPWTGGKSRLIYLPSRRLLWRDGLVVRLPKPVASRLMRRSPLL
jgi:hypothetical protein